MTRNRTINIIIAAALLSSTLYCFGYIGETISRSLMLSKLSYSGKQLYLENSYKYPPVYEYSRWLNSIIPDGNNFSLYSDSYIYDYTRLIYHLYPKYIPASVGIVSDINDKGPDAMKRLTYGDIVFANSLDKNVIYRDIDGLLYSNIGRNKYLIAAKYGSRSYLLIKHAFFWRAVTKERSKWSNLIVEFNILYPKDKI